MGKSAIQINRERWLAAKASKKNATIEEKEALVTEIFKETKATPKVKKSLLSTLLRKDS